ncbi:MAG: DUF378 domain-containing protein [Gammaproteobacteria bacterium]|nr:DUF378 domain-containing protein [Gammaproteobacteria bacterium]
MIKKHNALDWIAFILLVIGGLNWGLVGLFHMDLVAMIFGVATTLARIVYVLVGLSAIYVAIKGFACHKACDKPV